MTGPPLGSGRENITWPDQVAPRGRKASSTRNIKHQTSNLYMDATTTQAMEHFRAGSEARGFQRAKAGGVEDMTPTLHPSWHRVDTFLVNGALLPWLLRESVWARGMAHPQVIGSDHLPFCLALPGVLDGAGYAAVPTPYSHNEGRLLS